MDEQKAIEDLSYIKRIMEDSRKTFVDNGIGYIAWGVIIVLGLLSSYLMLNYKVKALFGYNWVMLVVIGWIFSFWRGAKRKKNSRAKSFAGKIIASVWLSSGIAMSIVGFIGTTSGAINGLYVSPIISIILGIAYFISGVVYGNIWISLLSIGWWGGAILMLFWPGTQIFLIMSIMMILFQIVPGIILYLNTKKALAN